MTYRPPIQDPVSVVEERSTGLCDECKKEDELQDYVGRMLCNNCVADTLDLYMDDGYYE
jgi:Zn finger protein HypA/HybF involved in hydrogenase expression